MIKLEGANSTAADRFRNPALLSVVWRAEGRFLRETANLTTALEEGL